MADTVRGGALVTMIRAEEKADDQIKAKVTPAMIALMSIVSLSRGRAPARQLFHRR